MGAAVIILFFLPWIDRNVVKSIRYRSTLYKLIIGIFVITFIYLGYLGTQSVTAINAELAVRLSELYFLFFVLLYVYSKPRSAFSYLVWFVVLLGIITAYDFSRVNPEIEALAWKGWLIPAAYLFLTLVLAAFTKMDMDKPVPERVTA